MQNISAQPYYYDWKFVNSTLKLILKQNLYKIDSILSLFTDQNGEINTDEIVAEYSKMIDENGIVFGLKKYIDKTKVLKYIYTSVIVVISFLIFSVEDFNLIVTELKNMFFINGVPLTDNITLYYLKSYMIMDIFMKNLNAI